MLYGSLLTVTGFVLRGHTRPVQLIEFSTDGRVLASAPKLQGATARDEGTIRVWDTGKGVLLHSLKGYWLPINTIRFSSDGGRLASAWDGGTVKVWDLENGVVLMAHESFRLIPHHDNKARVSLLLDRAITLTEGRTQMSDRALYGGLLTSDPSFRPNESGSLKSKQSATKVLSTAASWLSLQDWWICVKGQRTIWLPPEYRPLYDTWATHGGVMTLGHVFGGVSIWEIHEPRSR
jgi:WD40 repeat protein